MSNQNYSNETRKYYGMRGFNDYGTTANQTILSGTNSQILINKILLETETNLISLTDNKINFLSEGMYSLRINLGITSATNPSTSILSFDFRAILITNDSRSNTPLISLHTNLTSTIDVQVNTINENYTGYFYIGDSINFTYNNESLHNDIILSIPTSILINKIS